MYFVHVQAKAVIARLQHRAAECGNKLSNLYPSLARDWWPLIEDVFCSPADRPLARTLALRLSWRMTSAVAIHIACTRILSVVLKVRISHAMTRSIEGILFAVVVVCMNLFCMTTE